MCTGANSNPLVLKNVQFPNVVVSGELPEWPRIVHNWTDESLIQLNTTYDVETTPPVEERAKHCEKMGKFLLDLIDSRRPGQPCSIGHPR
jgi:hypothetical protein